MNIINGRIVDNDGEDITGDVGTVIIGGTGPIHLGTGNVYTTVFSGPGVTITQGNNPDGIRKTFGNKKKRK